MRKTIFGRILLANILTVSFCLLALGTLIFTFFTNYIIGEKKQTLYEEVKHVSEITVFFQDNPSAVTNSFYNMNINEIAHRVGGTVFLIGPKGEILSGAGNLSEHIGGPLPPNMIPRFFAGKHVHLGNLDGFFRNTYLLVSEPISYHNSVPAVSCVAIPVPRINQYRNDIFSSILMAIFLTMLLTAIVSYFVSRRISSPLKRISTAAQSIAKGDFSVHVPVRGNDEIAALSETFNQMTFSLKKLEDMRDGFISGVSHELRTPMTTISGFIQGILDETIPPERQGEYLHIVFEETKRLSRLVNELLLVARMEGGLRLKKENFDINELIRISILRFESVFAEKNIEPDIHFSAETCPVYADRDAIDRVLINLFDNALKFNRTGGYVKVSVTSTDGFVTVSVENSGEGISEEDLGMIWDKFYKTDRSRSQDKTGVGLGLYLVKNIITAHGGKITAESTRDIFTRFTFRLPQK